MQTLPLKPQKRRLAAHIEYRLAKKEINGAIRKVNKQARNEAVIYWDGTTKGLLRARKE